MDDEAGPVTAADADEPLHAAEARRAVAVGLALIRAKHDLNNLFHVSRGWSRLLKDPRSGVHQTQEGIEAVLSAAEQTSDLINGILALGGRATHTVSMCNLADELASLARGLRYLLPTPDRLRVELATHALVSCNFAEVRQALLDSVLAIRGDIGNDELVLRVCEAEPAKDSPEAPEVLLLLEQIPKGRASGVLPERRLCLRFAATRGGTVTFEPTLEPQQAARTSAFSATAPSSTTVLLVDDHRDVRRLATTMLERAGYQVLTASDAEEALVTSQSYDGPIQVLCCDAQMPGMPALRLITELCAARPALKVLVCTGERPEGKLADFPRLAKPFSYQQLITAVRTCLE